MPRFYQITIAIAGVALIAIGTPARALQPSALQATIQAPIQASGDDPLFGLQAGSSVVASPTVQARLVSRNSVDLAAAINGTILEVGASDGDTVSEGAELVRFDCAVETAELKRAEAERTAARSQADITNRLGKLNGVAAGQIARHRADAAIASADVEIIHAELDKCVLKAPFGATVSEVFVDVFGFARIGDPLLRLIDETQMELEAIVPSSWLRWLDIGQTGMVTLDETGQTYPITVIRIGAEIDPVSRSVKVVAELTGPETRLRAGMSGFVKFTPDDG
jgi:membrane fusion protein, multidrug efflux system